MMGKINGKEISEGIIKSLEEKAIKEPKRVAFVLFKDDPASRSFISIKKKVAERLGIEATVFEKFGLNTREAVSFIESLSNQGLNGIVVQLPLGELIDTESVLNAIPQELDIDVLGENSKLAFMKGETSRIPPVAGAILKIMEKWDINLTGKRIAVLGMGKLVGEAVWMLLKRMNLEFAIFDKESPASETISYLKTADIIISGIGVPGFIKPEMVRENVVLIDAGTSEQAGKIVGDIDPSCEAKAFLMTPVPGGVGPITVAVLFENLFCL